MLSEEMPDGRVIHIGSFSKSIAPALRVGWLVADWTVMSRILAIKNDAGSGALEQMVLECKRLNARNSEFLTEQYSIMQRVLHGEEDTYAPG